MKTPKTILLGIMCYLAFIIVQTPAAILYDLIPDDAKNDIQLGRLSGTLWNGNVDIIRIDKHQLTELSWSLTGWKLLLGKLAVSLDGHYQQQPVTTDLSISITGVLALDDTHAIIDAATVGDIIQMPIGELGGSFELQLEHAEIAQGSIPAATGVIRWQNAAITIAETARLGDVNIQLSESDNLPLTANISNKGGDIKLDGNASIAETGDYKLELNMLPSTGARKNISNSLKLFAAPQRNGSFQINNSGNLDQLGIM